MDFRTTKPKRQKFKQVPNTRKDINDYLREEVKRENQGGGELTSYRRTALNMKFGLSPSDSINEFNPETK